MNIIDAARFHRAEVAHALRSMGKNVLTARGGFFIDGEGFISIAKARRLTGIAKPETKPREKMESLPWGDYATITAFAGARR